MRTWMFRLLRSFRTQTTSKSRPMPTNGRAKKFRHRKRRSLSDNDFSRELAKQGDEGKFMRLLFLKNPMVIYMARLNDEPIHP